MLTRSEIPEEYGRAAHDLAPLDVWKDVIRRYPDMKKWVAHNKSVPLEILEILARDGDPRVRSFVAMKRKLSRNLFDLLSNDPDASVRRGIACNRKAPREVIQRLSRDPVQFVREAAAGRLELQKASPEQASPS